MNDQVVGCGAVTAGVFASIQMPDVKMNHDRRLRFSSMASGRKKKRTTSAADKVVAKEQQQ